MAVSAVAVSADVQGTNDNGIPEKKKSKAYSYIAIPEAVSDPDQETISVVALF